MDEPKRRTTNEEKAKERAKGAELGEGAEGESLPTLCLLARLSQPASQPAARSATRFLPATDQWAAASSLKQNQINAPPECSAHLALHCGARRRVIILPLVVRPAGLVSGFAAQTGSPGKLFVRSFPSPGFDYAPLSLVLRNTRQHYPPTPPPPLISESHLF